ncbi:MAG: hypothetical protein NTW74_26560 [Acidobacteria bacterium]|nr:hypothetical protein [Acidobacteriota bacterium]
MKRFLVGLSLSLGLMAADAPEAVLDNGVLKAVFHLPDVVNGSYRGSRFDWSGVVKSLEYKKHSYFGVWYGKHDPLHHDAITGPVEEFLSGDEALGYSEAKVGGNFVRIGIGAMRKETEAKFERFGRYKLVDSGKWTVSPKKDRITFRQNLKDASSAYSYRYEKTVRLVPGKPEMWIEHRLKNTGKKVIETSTYNHNFFVIDGEPTGPNLSVQFGFDAVAKSQIAPNGAMEGRRLSYVNELKAGQTVMSEFTGFGAEAKDYEFRVENRKTGAGVRVTGDKPLSKVIFWSIRSVLSPEPYISMKIAPGESFSWTIRYEFYELSPGK